MDNHYNCIYMYINKINGHKYVGQAINFNRRYKQHIHSSKNKNMKDYNYPLHIAIRKYGIENFEIIILKENIKTQCLINLYECYYIEKYNCLSNKNYNCSSGGSNGYSLAGKSEDELKEIYQKISDSNKGRIVSEETKQKLSEILSDGRLKGENHPMYGKHHTEEVKEKMRKPKPDEYKQKMSEKRKGEGNPYYGKKHSKEWKEKASKRNKGSNNGNSKKVIQYTKDGEIVKIWNCAKQITEELNISYNSLINRLNGKVKTKELNGFIWKYEKDVNKNDN